MVRSVRSSVSHGSSPIQSTGLESGRTIIGLVKPVVQLANRMNLTVWREPFDLTSFFFPTIASLFYRSNRQSITVPIRSSQLDWKVVGLELDWLNRWSDRQTIWEPSGSTFFFPPLLLPLFARRNPPPHPHARKASIFCSPKHPSC